ncbi:protein YrbN [Salmonella enterica]|nr:protein YrbN [Salmonella enterica]
MKIADQFHDDLFRLAAINFEAHVLHG